MVPPPPPRTLETMNCPSDGSTLLMSERQGIEIDYCPQCRGIWLDRGELDKMLESAKAESASHGHFSPAPHRDEYGSEAPRTGRHYDASTPAPSAGGYGGGYGSASPSPAPPASDHDSHGSAARYGDPRTGEYDFDPRRGRDSRQGQRRKKSPFEFLGDIFD